MQFVGSVIHSISLSNLEIIPNCLLTVKDNKVCSLKRLNEIERRTLQNDSKNIQFLKPTQFLIPGLIDCHLHAPQFLNLGSGIDLPLLDWLNKYTFPKEASFSDAGFANDVYLKVVDRLLSNGTTTCCYYGTCHLESNKKLIDIMVQKGQRGFVGKVCMDRNSPEFYIETTMQSVQDTIEFVKYCQGKESSLVKAVITPRFIPTCTDELLLELSKIANANDLLIQSHLSENLDECKWVSELHPISYSEAYDKFGLLSEKTLMAHCIHLSQQEIDLLKKRNVGICHCPNSNFNLSSGILKVKKLLQAGIKVGLGTDCSGGYSSSMLDSQRQAINASKIIPFLKDSDENCQLSLAEAFYMATKGSASVLNIDNVGNFIPGSLFDALIIDVDSENSPIDFYNTENVYEMFEKFIICGDDRNIIDVYVDGKKVK